jgi:predicted MFS family arabinose efflux permease
MNAAAWRVTVIAATLMGLVGGGRTAFGLFVSPLNGATGLGLAGFSLAFALGQLAIGFAQPVVGALADRHGPARVVSIGAVLLAASTALPALCPLPAAVSFALVAGAVAGAAVGSNGLLMGAVNRAVPAARAGFAVGLVGAGASVGQLVLGPATQWAIDRHGWAWALYASALLCLVALPLAAGLRRAPGAATAPRAAQPVADVMRDPGFWRVAASFGVCGFHVAFLGAHMPGVIERCGLPASLAGTWIAVAGAANVAGSIAMGAALRRHDPARLLAGTYAIRAIGIAALMATPPTAAAMLVFAVVMGASHMATLPPTAQLVARRHGVERLGTLFGIVMLVHQVGSFAGVWLGGWAAEATGSDTLLWTADACLALVAAALVLPNGLARAGSRRDGPAFAAA